MLAGMDAGFFASLNVGKTLLINGKTEFEQLHFLQNKAASMYEACIVANTNRIDYDAISIFFFGSCLIQLDLKI